MRLQTAERGRFVLKQQRQFKQQRRRKENKVFGGEREDVRKRKEQLVKTGGLQCVCVCACVCVCVVGGG